MFVVRLAAAIAAASILPVAVRAAPTASSAASPAVQLANLIAPTDAPADKMIADIRAEFAKSGAMDDASDMEQQYPGITKEMLGAIEDSLGGKMKAQYQRMRAGYAEDYQRELKPAEIDGLVAFFSTPAGAKLAKSRDELVDPSEVLRRLVGKVVVSGPNTARRMVVADKVIATLTPAEAAEARAFTATPLFARFAEVTADATRLERDLANVRTRASQGMMQAMMAVMEKRTGMKMPSMGDIQQQMMDAPGGGVAGFSAQ